jgi:3-hydroxybutyryl-CoA dehydrogenase
MEGRLLGVIGAGVMGVGVAQNLAQTGHRVVLVDLSEAVLERARAEIRQGVRFQGMFKKDGPKVGVDEVLGRIEFMTSLEPLAEVEFVIENVTEKWEIKREVYGKIDAICRPEAVFVLTPGDPHHPHRRATKRAPKVLGMHHMNLPLKPRSEGSVPTTPRTRLCSAPWTSWPAWGRRGSWSTTPPASSPTGC